MEKEIALRKKILVADDSADVRKRIAAMLSELDGVEIIGPAKNGKEALRLFHEFAPDGAILDLLMPDMTGIEVLVAIRKTDKVCLVIMLSNENGEEFRSRSFREGANFFLCKSTEHERVREIIEAFVEGQK